MLWSIYQFETRESLKLTNIMMKVDEFYQQFHLITHRCRLRGKALGGRIGGACRLRLAGWRHTVERWRRSSGCTGSWHPSDRFPGRRWHCNKACSGSAPPWYTRGTKTASRCCKQPGLHRLRRGRGAPPCTRQPADDELGTPSLQFTPTWVCEILVLGVCLSMLLQRRSSTPLWRELCIADADCGGAFIFGIWGGLLWNYGSLRW